MSARKTLSPVEALEAIRARIDGAFDNEALLAWGPLNTDPAEDIRAIAEATLAEHGEEPSSGASPS